MYDLQAKALEHRDKIAQELFKFIRGADQTPSEALFGVLRARNFQLIEFLLEEERLMAHCAGETVEPKAHHIEARLIGRFGGRF
jgi:hypothetical protein